MSLIGDSWTGLGLGLIRGVPEPPLPLDESPDLTLLLVLVESIFDLDCTAGPDCFGPVYSVLVFELPFVSAFESCRVPRDSCPGIPGCGCCVVFESFCCDIPLSCG